MDGCCCIVASVRGKGGYRQRGGPFFRSERRLARIMKFDCLPYLHCLALLAADPPEEAEQTVFRFRVGDNFGRGGQGPARVAIRILGDLEELDGRAAGAYIGDRGEGGDRSDPIARAMYVMTRVLAARCFNGIYRQHRQSSQRCKDRRERERRYRTVQT